MGFERMSDCSGKDGRGERRKLVRKSIMKEEPELDKRERYRWIRDEKKAEKKNLGTKPRSWCNASPGLK